MNNILLKLKKIILKIFFISIILFLILYFSLWLIISNYFPKELKNIYNKNIENYLTDEQYDIILFSHNGNKKLKFKWYPFAFDFISTIISFKNHNYLASLTASTIVGEYFENNHGKYTNIDWHIMNYGLMRYIVRKNDYKKCINIFYDNNYMGGFNGENLLGIKNACDYYYQKNIKDISNEEFISLVVLSYNPQRYKINSEENKQKTLHFMSEY